MGEQELAAIYWGYEWGMGECPLCWYPRIAFADKFRFRCEPRIAVLPNAGDGGENSGPLTAPPRGAEADYKKEWIVGFKCR